jgi:integrase/recombinase XerD
MVAAERAVPGKTSETNVTLRYTVQNSCVAFPRPFGAGRATAHSFSTFEYFDLTGKGRKERCTPLAKPTAAILKSWMREQGREDSKTLFPSTRGGPLSADGVQHLLARHVAQARKNCVSLRKKRVSPHVLRHAAAMELLQGGVDRAVIALWLGHESVETTQIYLDADLALKEQALAKTNPVKGVPKRFQPDDELLAFLKQL